MLFRNRDSFLKMNLSFRKIKTYFDPLLVDLAWQSPDNLIEQEIKNIEAIKPSVFPCQMLEFLKDLEKSK